MARNDRFVVKHNEGWAVKKTKAGRSSSVHPTQRETEKRTKEIVGNLGGGEVRIQGRIDSFRDSDTMVDGNVPAHRVTSATDLGGLNMTKARLNLF